MLIYIETRAASSSL